MVVGPAAHAAELAAAAQAPSETRESAPEPNPTPSPAPHSLNLANEVKKLVDHAVDKSVDHRTASRNAKRLSDGWEKISSAVDAAAEPNDWTVALPNSAEGVRIPKPLQQLLKPDHFQLQGHEFLREHETTKRLQANVDHHFRKCAHAVLKEVAAWKKFAADEHASLLTGVRGDLETKLTELYAGTEVPAAAVADRQATALRKYDADSLAKLDKLETSRKATEKAEAEEKARLDKAELEARSPMEGKDWAGHLQSSTEKIVSERNDERDAIFVAAVQEWKDADMQSDLATILSAKRQESDTAAAAALEAAEQAESSDDKLKRLRAASEESAAALKAFESSKRSGNGKPGRKSSTPASNNNAQDGPQRDTAGKRRRGKRGGKKSGH